MQMVSATNTNISKYLVTSFSGGSFENHTSCFSRTLMAEMLQHEQGIAKQGLGLGKEVTSSHVKVEEMCFYFEVRVFKSQNSCYSCCCDDCEVVLCIAERSQGVQTLLEGE